MRDVNELSPRREYLSSIAEIQGLRQTDFRWLTINVWQLKQDGGIDHASGPKSTFTDFILQTVNQMDRERLQMVAGVRDNVKIYFFDKELRQFSVQGFIYDMPYDAKQELAGLKPFAFSVLRRLYDSSLRTSAAYRNRQIVELDYGQYSIYCTLSNMSSTATSDTPAIFVVSFVVLVEGVRIKENITPLMKGVTISHDTNQPIFPGDYGGPRGILSREAAIKIGLADNLYIDPIPITPSLTFGTEAALLETVPRLATEFPKDPKIVPKKKRSKKTNSGFTLGV